MKKKQQSWTVEQYEVLLNYYETKGGSYCTEMLAALGVTRTRTSVGQMARMLGLKYQGPHISQFKKGHVPASKGKKLSPEQYKALQNTMFQPGCRCGAANSNYVPIGHETMRHDGYTYVKIAERRWRQKHQVIWEKQYGPIPKGHIIVFRDGNPNNFRIENLECISQAENLYRNRTRPPSEYSLITGRAAKMRLRKAGFSNQAVRDNPELLNLAQKQTIITIKTKKNATKR